MKLVGVVASRFMFTKVHHKRSDNQEIDLNSNKLQGASATNFPFIGSLKLYSFINGSWSCH